MTRDGVVTTPMPSALRERRYPSNLAPSLRTTSIHTDASTGPAMARQGANVSAARVQRATEKGDKVQAREVATGHRESDCNDASRVPQTSVPGRATHQSALIFARAITGFQRCCSA